MIKKFSLALLVATFVCATPAFSCEPTIVVVPAPVEVSKSYFASAVDSTSAGCKEIANATRAAGNKAVNAASTVATKTKNVVSTVATDTKNAVSAGSHKVASAGSSVATAVSNTVVKGKDLSVEFFNNGLNLAKSHPYYSATAFGLTASVILLYNSEAIKATVRSVLGYSDEEPCTCSYVVVEQA